LWGTVVNALAIVSGAILGKILGRSFADNLKITVMQGLGLGVLLVGIQMAMQTNNVLIVIFSLVLGGITGELLRLEWHLDNLGRYLESRVNKENGRQSTFAQGFVTASLIYCVGAMAIMGALESGLTGQHRTLYAKSLLDGVMSIMLSSTLGLGVAFSALPVFVYQGSITLLARWIGMLLNEAVIAEMTATGGVLIIGIALGILEIRKINVGNLLPAVVFAFILGQVFLT